MRRIRYSESYALELSRLLEQGISQFGIDVVIQKRDLIEHTITTFLARHSVRQIDPVLGLCAYPVSKSPFVILFDFDDEELRVHLIIHGKADRARIDLSKVQW